MDNLEFAEDILIRILTIIRSSNHDAYINTFKTKHISEYSLSIKYDELYRDEIISQITDSIITTQILGYFNNIDICEKYQAVLSNKLLDESTKKLHIIFNSIKNIKYKNDMESQLKSPKYLFFGPPMIRYFNHIIPGFGSISIDYYGEFMGMKMYCIPNLKDIYISDGPILNLNNLVIKCDDIGDNKIVQCRSIIGDVDLIKISIKYDY